MENQSLYVYPPITSRQFPFYLDKQSYSEKGENFRAHWHEHFELIFIEVGTIGLICNGRELTATEGDLVILNPHDVHHLHSLTDRVEYYCLVFDLALLKTDFNDRANRDYLQPLHDKQLVFETKIELTADLVLCYQSLVAEQAQTDAANELMIKAHLNQLLALLIRTNKYTRLNPLRTQSSKKNLKLIQGVLSYLDDNYREEMDLTSLSEKFLISQHHLCHVFKTYTNRSIIQYINRLRVEKAMEYLQSTDKNITDIAFLVGYNDANYFSRMFKKYTSLSPRQWVGQLPKS